jgi:hypothetical protein
MRLMPNPPKGDPEGRRLARRRAGLLSEAGRVACVLGALLERADYDDAGACGELIKGLTKSEEAQLHRGYGRVESRPRFKKKNTGAPLLEKRPRNLLYIDESGKSIPQPLGPLHPPFFALGAVAMKQEEQDNYCVAADEIKLEFFGRLFRAARSSQAGLGGGQARVTVPPGQQEPSQRRS